MDWEAMEMVCSVDFWRMAVLWTLSLLYSYVLLMLKEPLSFFRRRPCRLSYTPHLGSRLRGLGKPICIITGGTSGLGAAAARSLAGKGYCVVLAGRSPQLLSKIVDEIMEQVEDAEVEAFVVDLSSTQSIMKFKSALEQWLSDSGSHFSVQLLINNAGILAATHRLTADGYDQMMETNYLGAFCLTNILLPLLKNSPVPSRIVNVTSFTHRCVSSAQVNGGDLVKTMYYLSSSKGYPFARVYEDSKFCLLLFTYELHRRLHMIQSPHKISVIAADPGVVDTKIMRELPPCLSRLAFKALLYLRLLQTPEAGIGAVVDAALAPPEASGLYFFGGQGRTIRSSATSYNQKLADELWTSSLQLLCKANAELKLDGDFSAW
ncbi:unnamed protein product [Spirodela intermedia]|uniref:Uncharacterized protein n=2 Tax=Spirodela intermedia TaxID=51605 RepID=A0A7I8LFN6_SPIIN|nr:unnamed protein product [Spirodela intermedia]CAA6671722.1 unnamed protein product [Spirodela intermedia]CAA7408839.1 unnamed protein product [Spirodela intermedia]